MWQQHRPLEKRVDSYDQQEVLSRMQTVATRFRLTKWELTTHFAHHLGVKPPLVRAFFAELERLAEDELKRTGEFMVPGVAKVVVQRRWARRAPGRRFGSYESTPSFSLVATLFVP